MVTEGMLEQSWSATGAHRGPQASPAGPAPAWCLCLELGTDALWLQVLGLQDTCALLGILHRGCVIPCLREQCKDVGMEAYPNRSW